MEDLVERVRHGAEIELATDLRIDAEPLDAELETVVYRLAQEALTNIIKQLDRAGGCCRRREAVTIRPPRSSATRGREGAESRRWG